MTLPALESCRDIDPVEDTERVNQCAIERAVVGVAGISIRLRILKATIVYYPGRVTEVGCRDIDPVEDTERLTQTRTIPTSSSCRDIDPVEDTESQKRKR